MFLYFKIEQSGDFFTILIYWFEAVFVFIRYIMPFHCYLMAKIAILMMMMSYYSTFKCRASTKLLNLTRLLAKTVSSLSCLAILQSIFIMIVKLVIKFSQYSHFVIFWSVKWVNKILVIFSINYFIYHTFSICFHSRNVNV